MIRMLTGSRLRAATVRGQEIADLNKSTPSRVDREERKLDSGFRNDKLRTQLIAFVEKTKAMSIARMRAILEIKKAVAEKAAAEYRWWRAEMHDAVESKDWNSVKLFQSLLMAQLRKLGRMDLATLGVAL